MVVGPTRDLGLESGPESINHLGIERAAEFHQPPLGRWCVGCTNSWLSNYGQMRRNTDRCGAHRVAQMALAIALILTAKLIDWRNRWTPDLRPIR